VGVEVDDKVVGRRVVVAGRDWVVCVVGKEVVVGVEYPTVGAIVLVVLKLGSDVVVCMGVDDNGFMEARFLLINCGVTEGFD
jgi:hypothetical protein